MTKYKGRGDCDISRRKDIELLKRDIGLIFDTRTSQQKLIEPLPITSRCGLDQFSPSEVVMRRW